MTKIIDIVNGLIKRAKENSSIADVTFVKAFRQDIAQSPVDGFIAVVKIENINISGSFAGGYAESNIRGEMYTAKVELEIFSGSDVSGESLSDTTLKILDAIKKADESSMISDTSVSPISFDDKINAICRKLTLQLDYCLCGDADD